jgi:nicotinamidase-related amidase
METHICVWQTVRGLLGRAGKGASVHVVADACASRSKQSWRVGLGLAERAGAVITTTEVVVFDLLGKAGTDDFKALSKLIR